MELAPERGSDSDEQVNETGDEDRRGTDPTDAASSALGGGQIGRRRPCTAHRPGGDLAESGRIGCDLGHWLAGGKTLRPALGGQRLVAHEQADVEVCAGLDLERGLEPMIEEHRREAEDAPVLSDHPCRRADLGEEADVEVGEARIEGA